MSRKSDLIANILKEDMLFFRREILVLKSFGQCIPVFVRRTIGNLSDPGTDIYEVFQDDGKTGTFVADSEIKCTIEEGFVTPAYRYRAMDEFVGKYLFGVNSSTEILQRLKDVDNWFQKNHRRVNEPFVHDKNGFFDLVYEANLMGDTDEEYMSNMDLLGDAFDRWVLLPITVAGVPLVEVRLDEYRSNELFQFCPEDLDNLIALTKKINERGYAELKSMLQRRTLVFVS